MLCYPHCTRYLCLTLQLALTAVTSVPASSVFLGVVEPPTIPEKPEVVRVTRGDPVSLECRVAGTPPMSVRWIKDGQNLQLSSKYDLHYGNNLSSLNIQSCQLGDGGEFEFDVSNSVGRCSCKVHLVVLGL